MSLLILQDFWGCLEPFTALTRRGLVTNSQGQWDSSAPPWVRSRHTSHPTSAGSAERLCTGHRRAQTPYATRPLRGSGIAPPPLGFEAATPHTQHHRRAQRRDSAPDTAGHRPPTRRTMPGPLTERPTHRPRIARFDAWFRRRQHTLVTVALALPASSQGESLKAYKVVTTTESRRASTEQKSVPTTTPRCLPPGVTIRINRARLRRSPLTSYFTRNHHDPPPPPDCFRLIPLPT